MFKTSLTYILLSIWTPVYLIVFLLICAAKGASEQVGIDLPKEWRMVRNHWKSVRTLAR